MFSSALAEKITGSCGTRPMRERRSCRSRCCTGTPSTAMPPVLRVVEAQQQLEHRALAGAAGADQGHRLAGRDRSVKSFSAGVSGRDG
jgi:hypothetical protein